MKITRIGEEVEIGPVVWNFFSWTKLRAGDNKLSVAYYFLNLKYRTQVVSSGRLYLEKTANSSPMLPYPSARSSTNSAPYEWRLHIVNGDGGVTLAKSAVVWPSPPNDLLPALRKLSAITGWGYTFKADKSEGGAHVKRRFMTNRKTKRRAKAIRREPTGSVD